MKYSLLAFIVLAFLLPACGQKHYTKLDGGMIVLYYKDSEAQEVVFASSRDNFKYLPARETKKHLWEVSVPAVNGFTYFYIVDGVVTLPDCPYTENDDFGSKNCLFMADM